MRTRIYSPVHGPEERMWLKRNGTVISIDDMRDEHIVNALKMAMRGSDYRGKAVERTQWIDVLKQEVLKRNIQFVEEGWDI